MKKILVLGLGKSGLSVAEWLLKEGSQVLGFDDKSPDVERLAQLGLEVLRDIHAIDWSGIALLVVSPGVPPTHPLYASAVQHGIEVVGEMEFALRLLSQKAVAITGTNGKTTVTLLVEHILKSAGIKARSLGNIGEPLSAYVGQRDVEEVLVVELSSFQIETLSCRAFDAGVILNITPDHLDRYSSMQEYARAKCGLQNCLKDGGKLFVHPGVSREYGHLLSSPYSVYGGDTPFFKSLEAMVEHDRDNALAAWVLCQACGVNSVQFIEALSTFQKPSHRIEFVCEIDGICYYDDSKGTNIDAVVQAVRAMPGPVILIAGGVDKGASYAPWADSLKGKIKSIFCLGQAAPKIERELQMFFEIERVDSLALAVEKASANAARGDAVLLSPGCSSFDMFEDYAHRGREFKRCVNLLERR